MIEASEAIFSAIENGDLDPEDILRMCLSYMTEEDIRDMLDNNELESLYMKESPSEDEVDFDADDIERDDYDFDPEAYDSEFF
jgi:hypothetical protein